MDQAEQVRVLIVEDDYLTREMIGEQLGEIGCIVIGNAGDGLQAVEAVTRLAGTPEQVDVILMDIQMPGMDGIEATRLIQERCPTPVVALTAYQTPELVEGASAAGVGAYLIKPPEAHEVRRAITIAMARFDDMMALRRSNQRLEEALVELETAQQRVIQQERLAAVGQLAAGVAHDFNNILTSVLLYADVVRRKPHLPADIVPAIATITHEARRAARLVQQILDFGRRSMLNKQRIDVARLIEDVSGILRDTLPEAISISVEAGPGDVEVYADPTSMRQALMNLCVNARDAMPEGGNLHISLSKTRLLVGEEPPDFIATSSDRVTPQSRHSSPGMQTVEWICLAVSDSGTGMSAEVASHIFEPFFTTKEVGQGSGLGLPQVYGIVKQHKGTITVETKDGQGTTIRIYLPPYEAREPEGVIPAEETPLTAKEQGTVLLIEEEEHLRQVLHDVLLSLGYRVLAMRNGRAALASLRRTRGDLPEQAPRIDLVVADLAMPVREARELMPEMRRANPHVRGLAITDHERGVDRVALQRMGIVDVIQKPFDIDTLTTALRRAMDEALAAK